MRATPGIYKSVTPSDTDDLPRDGEGDFPDCFRFGTGGTVVLVGLNGEEVTFTNISDGETLWFSARQIKATGTSDVDDIVAGYL